MCVGATGIGKTTLMESLFNQKLELEHCSNELKTVELRTQCMGGSTIQPITQPPNWYSEVTEGGVTVRLRIVETAGFGDQLEKEER